jgi:hypothetical protein
MRVLPNDSRSFDGKHLAFTMGKLSHLSDAQNLISHVAVHRREVLIISRGGSGGPILNNERTPTVAAIAFAGLWALGKSGNQDYAGMHVSISRLVTHYFVDSDLNHLRKTVCGSDGSVNEAKSLIQSVTHFYSDNAKTAQNTLLCPVID